MNKKIIFIPSDICFDTISSLRDDYEEFYIESDFRGLAISASDSPDDIIISVAPVFSNIDNISSRDVELLYSQII